MNDVMNEHDFIKQAAERFESVGGCSIRQAYSLAVDMWECRDADDDQTGHDAADVEMSYWEA